MSLSFTSYFLYGSSAAPSLTRTASAPVQAFHLADSFQFDGAIETETGTDGAVYSIVDKAIAVKQPDPEESERFQQIWQTYAFRSALVGVVPLALTTISSSLCSMTDTCPDWLVDSLSLPTLILGIGAMMRGIEAIRQRDAWANQYADQLAEGRRLCADHEKHGFSFLKQLNLKGRVLSEVEVTHLWKQSVQYYRDQLSAAEDSTDPADLIQFYEAFFARSPLDGESLLYAGVESEGLSEAFCEARATYQQVRKGHWSGGQKLADALTVALSIPLDKLFSEAF